MKLSKEFYNRTSIEVAKDILGKYLVFQQDKTQLVGKIVETEAYMGLIDKAAHSYNNKKTTRNEIMFGPSGFTYVYMIYGMYYCFNIVTSNINEPNAVLIRALEPISGFDEMSNNRFSKKYQELSYKQKLNLTNGPGKLCKAFGITKIHNGLDLMKDTIYIEEPLKQETFSICQAKRINIDYAEEAKDYLWRFYIKENEYVSKIKE